VVAAQQIPDNASATCSSHLQPKFLTIAEKFEGETKEKPGACSGEVVEHSMANTNGNQRSASLGPHSIAKDFAARCRTGNKQRRLPCYSVAWGVTLHEQLQRAARTFRTKENSSRISELTARHLVSVRE
jgi:hypothetical protein